MRLLTAGELSAVTGTTMKTIDNWSRWQIITPVEGGNGKGSHRRFSIVQAVAISAMLGFADLGIPLKLLKSIHDLLSPFTVESLLKEIAFGYRAFDLSVNGGAKLIGLPEGGCPNFARVDLTLYRIRQQIKAMEGQQQSSAVDRRRGLTAKSS